MNAPIEAVAKRTSPGKGMKRNAARGAAIEKKAQAILEADGYLVTRAAKALKWINGRPMSVRHDFFGCFDLIAIKPGELVRFVQVGTKQMRRKKERDVLPVAQRSNADASSCEVWAFVAGRRPEGQRFLITVWNGLEWAEMTSEACE